VEGSADWEVVQSGRYSSTKCEVVQNGRCRVRGSAEREVVLGWR
jgi:hypothetical protein